VQGICPSGWHLPSDGEWSDIENTVGTSAATKLKSESGWNGSDDYGFSALSAGYLENGMFWEEGDQTFYWSTTEYAANNNLVWFRVLRDDVQRYFYSKEYAGSVRCIEN